MTKLNKNVDIKQLFFHSLILFLRFILFIFNQIIKSNANFLIYVYQFSKKHQLTWSIVDITFIFDLRGPGSNTGSGMDVKCFEFKNYKVCISRSAKWARKNIY